MSFDPSPLSSAAAARKGASLPTPWIYLGAVGLGVALFLVLLTGLPNFTDNEWRLTAYVLDVLHNGRLFVQTDSAGDVASKPPLLTWLVSLAVLPTGHVTRFAMYWPSAAATIVLALVLLRAGTSAFNWQAGFFAAFTYLVSYATVNQMAMPRYDGLLALPVTLAALAAFRAWETGKGWTIFWLFAAIGTLVKGPLALVLSAGGLLAVFFTPAPGRRLRGSHWIGLLVFLAITGGWFGLAYLQMGDALIDKMIRRELVRHAVSGYSQGREWLDYADASWNCFRSYAPWSLLALVGFWRVLKQPAEDPTERKFERFLLASFLVGLAVFTLASHQRGRLILPLIPFAALLAGRELSRWTQTLESARLFRWTAVASCLFLAAVALHAHWLVRRSSGVQETLAARDLVARLQPPGAGEFPFTYVDNFHALQVWANTRRTMAPVEEAMNLLRGDTPAFVVVTKQSLPLAPETDAGIHEVYRWPAKGKPEVRIFSNHPRLERTENAALWVDGLRVRLVHTRLRDGDEDDLHLVDDASAGEITVVNRTSQARQLTLYLDRPGPDDLQKRKLLAPDVPLVLSWAAP